MKDSNGTCSAKAAGYQCSTDGAAAVCAVQVLRSTKVQERIFELTAELRQRVEEMVVDRDGNPTGVWKYEGHVADRGLELIGKNLGMFSETAKELTENHYIR